MIRMKKMWAMLLATTMTVGLMAGCGNSGGDSSTDSADDGNAAAEEEAAVDNDDSAEEENVENTAAGSSMEFWLDKIADQEKADKMAEALLNDSGVDVKFVNYPDTAAYQTAMQQSIDEASAPGMFTWWSGPQLETLAKNGKIADLTDEWDTYIEQGISPDIREAFTFDGKAYAAPYSILYNVCYMNNEVFENAGITEPLTTFDEFMDACEKIKESGVTPIGLKNDSWASFIWFQQMVAAYEPQLYIDICDGTKEYTHPDVKAVMEIWKEMFDKGYFASPVDHTDHFKNFAIGEVGIIIEPNTFATSMELDYGKVPGEDFDAFVLPSMNGDKGVIYFEASPICITEASADKETALEVLRSFFKDDTQKVMVDELGIANTSSVPVENVTIEKIVEMSADADSYQMILRYYENTPEEIRNYALDELARFMYSGADIDEVLGNIQNKADEVWADQ